VIYNLRMEGAITAHVPYLGGNYKYFGHLGRHFLHRLMFLVIFSPSANSIFFYRYEYTVSGILIGVNGVA
jgi:hypothetical protein